MRLPIVASMDFVRLLSTVLGYRMNIAELLFDSTDRGAVIIYNDRFNGFSAIVREVISTVPLSSEIHATPSKE